MKKIIVVLLFFSAIALNAQQLSKIKRSNLKIVTGKEQLPVGENSSKVVYKTYIYEEKFGDFIKSLNKKDSIIYEYNNIGQIISFENYNEDVNIQYKYDLNNFLVEEFDSIKNYPNAKYQNDDLGKVLFKYNYGRLGQEISKTTFQYDEFGKIVKQTIDLSGIVSFCTYRYDSKNNIIEEKTPVIFNTRTITTQKYQLDNLIDYKKIHYDGNGEVQYRNNGGYKHFVHVNISNNNNNWVSRVTYEVSPSDINNKKKIEFTERTFY